MVLVSGNIRFMRIFGRSMERGRQTSVELLITAIFSDFAGCIFGKVRDTASRDTKSLVGFLLISKHLTLSDREWSMYSSTIKQLNKILTAYE